ncbi:bis-aminopropyl spermidine synthase family protein [Pseudofrankia inefficax]|uniref:N(4)-bis(aminopropyl)spermidine synthase C-terminal domain-containing protein n=1 Tax=Pseudofrankia inefficax (strain DSM 45817 / CECT 9037 / DDB 130130 / EuI1c) TaxID=298654 RepID=E3J334_PSEI1|nr:bis-aminopropyl spermidine synthase family protein [Pseudofrankia inefficax]ADP82984.1 protein of unknown function DUF43 [Pseudofrankia inefficax]
MTSGDRPATDAPPADGPARLAELLGAYGPYGRPLRSLLVRLVTATPLDGEAGSAGVGRLVRAVGLPRRTVEEVLAALGDDVVEDPRSGPRLRPDRVDAYRPFLTPGRPGSLGPADEGPEPDRRAAHDDLSALIAAAPRPRADLDHVAATATTALARAVWLRDTYDLAGARLLCAGDHDLTSLAAASLIPGLRVTVVDVDEELLDFVGEQAARRRLPVQTLFADLRFGLPPSVAGDADLVFTDPPYTPDGVALFCARGAEALRDRERGRVLLAYGFSDRTPTLGWKVQRALSDAGFVIEAMLPGFHAYDGAEAIGARADHYVCRPTPHTWRQLDRSTGPWAGQTAIYTRGRAALESAAAPVALAGPPVAILRDAAAEAAGGPDGAELRLVVVADALPAELAGAGHTRLATLLAKGLPAAKGPRRVAVAADLTDDPGGWLPRLLLAANADGVAALVRADHPVLAPGQPAPAAGQPLLAAKWCPRPPRPAGSSQDRAEPLWVVSYTAVDADQSRRVPGSDAGRLSRYLLDRAHGRVGNVWREGLVRLAREATGAELSRREAGERVTAALAGGPAVADVLAARLVDLPGRTLAAVLTAAAATADAVIADTGTAGADAYAVGAGAAATGPETHLAATTATPRGRARASEEDRP